MNNPKEVIQLENLYEGIFNKSSELGDIIKNRQSEIETDTTEVTFMQLEDFLNQFKDLEPKELVKKYAEYIKKLGFGKFFNLEKYLFALYSFAELNAYREGLSDERKDNDSPTVHDDL